MIRFELLAQRARALGLDQQLSAQLAYAYALTEASLAQRAHSDASGSASTVAQGAREGARAQALKEIELLFLASELQ